MFLDNIPVLQAVPHISTWPEIEDAANGLFEEGYYTGAEAAEVANEIDQGHAAALRPGERGIAGCSSRNDAVCG